MVRIGKLGIPATTAKIERHSIPPGLGQASMAAVVHFTAADERGDAAVVFFECGHYVGRIDIVGTRGSRCASRRHRTRNHLARNLGKAAA